MNSGKIASKTAATRAGAVKVSSTSPRLHAFRICSRGAVRIHRNQREGVGDAEPCVLETVLSFEVGISRTACTHQPGRYGGDDDSVLHQFTAQSAREAEEGRTCWPSKEAGEEWRFCHRST